MSLSFKIERNPPASSSRPSNHQDRPAKRPSNRLATDFDSSDDEPSSSRRTGSIELITSFDSTRAPARPDPRSGPLSIPALPDRDFRAVHLARKTKKAKKALYKPDTLGGSDRQPAGDNEDREGLDRMNSRAIVGGLKTAAPNKGLDPPDERAGAKVQVLDGAAGSGVSTALEGLQVAEEPAPLVPETAEQRAVRELLSQANDDDGAPAALEAIHMPTRAGSDDGHSSESESGDETAQFRRDVARRPDASTLEDYARVPVGQFGLALLKGMGWTEGASTSRRGRKGLVEAYVPQARPSLLGIGAKPLVLDLDAPSTNGASSKGKGKNPERKYVPLLRKVIDQGPAAQRPRSRSRSPPSRNSSASSPRDRSPSHSERHGRDGHSSSRDARREDPRRTGPHVRHGEERRRHAERSERDRAHSSRRSDDTDEDGGRSSWARKEAEYGDRRLSRHDSRERRPSESHRRR